MNENVLGEHGRALEDSFFYKRNHDLLKKLREELDAQASREALLAACGVTDEAVLNQLVALGIHPETLTALCLVPLVQVAWADGSIDANERSAVLSVAQRQGLTKENVNYQLLQSWLEEQPNPKLVAVWKDYVRALLETLDTEARAMLKKNLVGNARSVAEAAGGLLGLGSKVSRSEQEVLDDLEQAFV